MLSLLIPSKMTSSIFLLIILTTQYATAFQSLKSDWSTPFLHKTVLHSAPAGANAVLSEDTTTTYIPIFDFSVPTTVDKIERLDDAIMGGISTSSVQCLNNQPYARWTGVCRTDGGGFCGFRTNAFETPLMVADTDGFYVTCRLTSDDDTDRRIWKMTTRTRPDRGELLYQAPLLLGKKIDDGWCTVKVPFKSFVYVRGPRIIPDGPPFNTTMGIYQIGMTMSKFVFGANLIGLENFRDGFFELQIKEIGLYRDEDIVNKTAIVEPKVLSKEASRGKRPLILKVLLPLTRIVFSEASNRRKSAMKILTQKRGMTRISAIQFCMRSRAKSCGWLRSITRTIQILTVDAFRLIFLSFLRLAVLYPIGIVAKILKLVKGSQNDPKPQAS